MVPVSLPGVKALHAVDATGVHPLLLCIGREGYVPYDERRPMELLTQANAVLGFNQCSLAKYLMIVASEDDPELDVNEIETFLSHVLARVDWREDLHFHTNVTIDTLDYSGTDLNRGSKLVIAAAGAVRRNLGEVTPSGLSLPAPFGGAIAALPGILVLAGPPFESYETAAHQLGLLTAGLADQELAAFPLLVVVDDAPFTARTTENFLWVTFTRSNPARDCYGVGAETNFKHWGCSGSLIIDARIKPGHAPPLVEDPEISARVDRLCGEGMSLHGAIAPS
jgi:4-hydroxy-3-polyprenylbenzoate decarboxylase